MLDITYHFTNLSKFLSLEMSSFAKFSKVIAGAAAVGGASLYYFYDFDRKKQVYASWTTNYTPSVKWDENWDQ